MQPHSNLEGFVRWPSFRDEGSLDKGRRCGRARSLFKDRETAVPFTSRPDQHALVAFDQILNDLIVPDQYLARGSLVSFPEIGAAFDVGKEERDGSCR